MHDKPQLIKSYKPQLNGHFKHIALARLNSGQAQKKLKLDESASDLTLQPWLVRHPSHSYADNL